jgi:IclR family acetate operon transcriptional repressor
MAANPGQYGISEMASILDVPNNSVFRISHTLREEGYLNYDDSSRKFSLSDKLFSIAVASTGEKRLLELAKESLQNLCDLTGETALVGTLSGHEGIILDQVVSQQPIKFSVDTGLRFPLYTGAPGKVFLAYMNEHERNVLLKKIKMKRFTKTTITTQSELKTVLRQVKLSGVAYDYEEEIEGLHCVAAPVFNADGNVIASIWITGLKFRLNKERLHELSKDVKREADALSARLSVS